MRVLVDEVGEVRGPRARRSARDAALLGAGALVLLVAALPVDATTISDAERSVFRGVNGVPGVPFVPEWMVMQLGMIAVVPVTAALALLAHRGRLAAALFVAGALAYGGGKLVKRVVERGRPQDLLDDVTIRGAASHGLGFVSGHAAVAAALATVAFLHLARPLRWVVVSLAVLVALARVHVGAHLPLDVLGGVALGVAAGASARLMFGRSPACS